MSDIVATGIFYHDQKDGTRKWCSGDMLFAHVRSLIDARAKRQRDILEAFAEKLGERYAADREARRKEVEALQAEIAELKASLPLRAVGGRAA